MAHPVDLIKEQVDRSDSFFRGIPLPAVNASGGWNATLAEELRGEFDWNTITSWELRGVVETGLEPEETGEKKKGKWEDGEREGEADLGELGDLVASTPTWAWVRGGLQVFTPATSLEYKFYGLHHIPNGTYELFALPESMRIDIRHIPTLYPSHHNETARIIFKELKRELQVQEDSLLLTDVKLEGELLNRLLAHLDQADARIRCYEVPPYRPPLPPSPPARRPARGRAAVRPRARQPDRPAIQFEETARVLAGRGAWRRDRRRPVRLRGRVGPGARRAP